MGGNRMNKHRTVHLSNSSMSSATDLTKAWLENLPTDVDEPTPGTPVPHRSTESRTHDARDEDDLVFSSASAHPLRRPRSRGETNSFVKRHSVKAPTSVRSWSRVAGRGDKAITSQRTDDESNDVDKAFEQLLGEFSAPRETSEAGKMTTVETGYASSGHELEDGGRDWKTSTLPWSRPTVTKGRTGQRQLPVPSWRSQFITTQETSEVQEPTEEGHEERKETALRRSDKDVTDLRCCSTRSSYRSPVKAPSRYSPQNSSTQTLTISESNAIEGSAFRKPLRSLVANSADRTFQSSRDFATQTFGQMATTSMASSGAQTEISAMTKPEEMLKDSLMNIREPAEKYLNQHSLEGARRSAASSRDKMAADDTMDNGFSNWREYSSKSLHKHLETSQESNSKILDESFEDFVEKWPKKNVRSAGYTVAESERSDVHSKGIPTADTASVKSRSLSGTDDNKRLMSLMLEEVKALKSFVQTHLDERQTVNRTGTNQARTRQRLGEEDPDSDSAVGLAITDKISKKRDSARSKQRSHRSRGHHSSHRRKEDEENEEDEYRPRRQSPVREKTWDDIRRRTSLEDMKNRHLSMAEGRDQRRYLDSLGAAPVYTTFPNDLSNYHRFMPATAYQGPFQPYQGRPVAPFLGFSQPSMLLPSYQAGLGNRFGYAPLNTRFLPVDQTYPLRVPFPNSVAVVPAVEPATYQATVRPALTFVPAGLIPTGQMIQSAHSAWSHPGQSIAKESQTRNPDVVTSGKELSLRVKGNESSTRSSYRSSSQPRKLMSSLNDALREAQEIRNLTERLGKDTQLTSCGY